MGVTITFATITNLPNGLGRYGVGDDRLYYVKNHLGSTVMAIPSIVGGTFDIYDYFPYGKEKKLVTGQSGTVGKITETFTGKEYDEQIQLDYFGARYYDADIGLWISPDPMRQFFSSYAYGSNPIRSIDKNGYEQVEANFIGPLLQTDWRKGDKFGFSQAAGYNISHNLFGEYKSIRQRRDLYSWVNSRLQITGNQSVWAATAIGVINKNIIALSVIPGYGGLANGANKAIFDDAMPRLYALMGTQVRGEAAVNWDSDQLAREQNLVQPLYDSMNPAALLLMNVGNSVLNYPFLLQNKSNRIQWGEEKMFELRESK